MAAVIIVGRRADRQIDVAELLVGAHRRPDIGVAGFLPGFLLPGLDAGLAGLRHGVEGPEQTAGDDIEAAHVARRRRPLSPPVHHRRADHDDAAHDHRRRTHGVIIAVDRPAQALREIDPAVGPECRHRLSGLGIERDHLRERGEDHDAFVIAIAPIGDAAMQPAIIGGNAETVLVDFWDRTPIWSRRWRRRSRRPATARSRCRACRRPSAASIHWRSWDRLSDWRP